MKYLIAFISLVAFGLLLSGCKDRAHAMNGDTNSNNSEAGQEVLASDQEKPSSDQLIFSLTRTPCFGTCPSYRLQIMQNGDATYEGIGHVELMGMHKARIGRDTLDMLVAEAERLGFFELEDKYDSPVTDLPSTIVTVTRNGKTKEVTGRVDPPQGFKALVGFAEELLAEVKWKPVLPQH